MNKRSLLKTLLTAALLCTMGVIAGEGAAVKGNKSSKIYHKASCQYYTAKGSTESFATEAAAKEAGYKPCKKCGQPTENKKSKTQNPK